MKRILALCLSLALLCGLFAGCSVTESSEPAAPQEKAETPVVSGGEEAAAPVADNGLYPEVHVAVSADMEDLTPCKPNGTTRSNVFWSIYETLFDFDDKHNMIPNLATGYTIVSDTEWDVKLYEKIYDAEGNHITADDVVFNVNWLIDGGNNIRYNIFDSIEKIDDYTVRYHWKEKPASSGDVEFPLCRTFIFSKTAWENHNFTTDPVGTANFKVESFTPGSTLVLVANENYWADNTDEDVSQRAAYHKTNVSRIVFHTLSESSSAVVGLQMGDIDFCDYVPTAMLSNFQEGGQYAADYNVMTQQSSDYYYMLPNMSDENPVTGADLNLRLAVYYALDNEMISAVMGNSNVPLKALGTDAYDDFETAWEDEPTYMNTCDMEKAKEYLAKSSYNGEELVLIGLSNEECKNALTMIQSQMIELGLNVKIQVYEKNFLLNTLEEKTGWDFYVASTGGATLAGSWERMISQSENDGWTAGWLKDDHLEELFDIASADETRSAETLKACMDYAMEIGCVYGVSVWSSNLVYNKDITDICYREGYWVIGGCTFEN